MKTTIFIILLLAHAVNAHAAVKTLKSSGAYKLTLWAQKVAKIYGIALKNSSKVERSETIPVYVFGHDASGFTVSGYARVYYTNVNMTNSPGPLNVTNADVPPPHTSCLAAGVSKVSDTEYGTCVSEPNIHTHLSFDPYDHGLGNPHGYCFGTIRTPTVSLSCVKGIRKYIYNLTSPPAIKSATEWSIFTIYTYPGDTCLPNITLIQPFAPASEISCSAKESIEKVKAELIKYRGYLVTFNNGVLAEAMNADLIELDAVLDEIQNGFVLDAGDIQGDTNPNPAARNPWTFTIPTLAVEGNTSHTNVIENTLSDKLKVRVTNAVKEVSIGFSVSGAPGSGWSFLPEGIQAVTRETVTGIAETGFKLGTEPGDYQIKATCAECCPGEVQFSAKAVTDNEASELQAVPPCDGTSLINTELPSLFVVKAYNKYRKEAVAGAPIEFKIIAKPEGASGASPTLTNTKTSEDYGLAQYRLKLGDKPGDYLVRARCSTCLANQDVICRGHAVTKREVALELNREETANPNDIYPETGKPRTPILRIIEVGYPNDNVSFTTAQGENGVSAVAELLPKDYYRDFQSGIHWTIEDSPDDPINSGNPEDPAYGGDTADFQITAPAAPTGRTHPLRYKLKAEVITPEGTFVSTPRIVKQDEIDKCRQEYLDYEFKDASKLDFAAVPRNRFTIGLGSDFVKLPTDCYAYIYPTRAQEVLDLKTTHPELLIVVTSGYRSPRKNIGSTADSASKSWHMYGNAVDIAVAGNAIYGNTKKLFLWEYLGLPKMLERQVPEKSEIKPVTLKYITNGSLSVVRKSFINPKYKPDGLESDPKPTTLKDGESTIYLNSQAWNQWSDFKKYLLKGSGGVPYVIENSAWIHLGE